MKALSIRQPWAWLILNAGKDIENRTWQTQVRGRVLIHAAKGMTIDEYENGFDTLLNVKKFYRDRTERRERRVIDVPSFEQLERGGIVGSIEIVDCVRRSDSPWFDGPYGFVLRDPKPLPFQTVSGKLGFFEVNLSRRY